MNACRRGIGKVQNKPRTNTEKQWQWDRNMTALHGREILSVTEDDLADIIRARAAVAKVQANRLMAELRAFFNWAYSLNSGFRLPADRNPAVRIGKLRSTENKKRKRFLTRDEIGLLLRAVAKEKTHTRRAVLLLLLSGGRKQEIVSAPMSEIRHRSTGTVLAIDGSRMKNGDDHSIHFGQWGSTLIRMTNSRWLIPSLASHYKLPDYDGPRANGWSKVSMRLRARMSELGDCEVSHWTWHDFRRTMRSAGRSLGLDYETREAMLSHKKTGLDDVYDVEDMTMPTEMGWRIWERHLLEIASELGLDDALFIPVEARQDKTPETPKFRFA